MKTQSAKPEKMLSFEEVVKPLLKWMEENCCPHDVVIADVLGTRLMNGEIGIPSEFTIKCRDEVKDDK